jgi:hypothetical protein
MSKSFNTLPATPYGTMSHGESTMREIIEIQDELSLRQRLAGFRSLSWSGIIAGVLAAISVQLLLNLLGIGIGAGSIDAVHGDQPGQGMAVGVIVWFALSWVVSLAIGAWTACQFSSYGDRRTGALQGFMVWAVASIVIVYLLSTAAGNLIGGTASVIGRTASLLGAGARSTAPSVAGIVSRATGITSSDISAQAGDVASDPKFQQVIGDDREALASLLVERGHMSLAQANTDIDKWQVQIVDGAKSAKSTVLKVEDKAASGVSATGFGSFFSLLLGLVAAVVGGIFGASPKFRPTTERVLS